MADLEGSGSAGGSATALLDAASPAPPAVRATSTAPGIRPSRGTRLTLRAITVTYLALLVAVPLVVILWRTARQGGSTFVSTITDPQATHAYQVTAIVAGSAVVIDTVFGIGLALLLARYHFPGRRLLNVVADVPMTVSPIVVGLALILVYGTETGWFGGFLNDINYHVIFALPGMVLATAFISLPLVLREVLPVLEEAGIEQEQAARSLGANSIQRFRRITLPTIKWALLYGVVLSAARSLGEFGAVRVVSGAISGQTETMTIVADSRAEQLEPGSFQISVVLIAVSALCIAAISLLRPKEHRTR